MLKKLTVLLVLAALVVSGVAAAVAQDEFVFGVVLVGQKSDRGWSQAHYEAGLYVEENLPGAKMLPLESLNSNDRPETTLDQVVEDMVNQGAQLIFTTSADFEVGTTDVAALYPDVTFINASGDDALWGIAPENLGNIMGQMEYGKMMAGCAAALKTETGKIGYVGPLVDPETTRLVNSVYLGAQYCYETYRGMDPAELEFSVTWIGFWFNLPGVTLDPTEVVNAYLDDGADVVISGIDTTEVIVVTGQRAAEGEAVWAIPYDFEGACADAPDICLGVPYFNWGPAYLGTAQAVMDGTWAQSWDWNAPDWDDINNPDTSAVGFVYGDGLTADEVATMDEFIAALAAGAKGEDGGLNLWTGPMNLQDGSVFLADGEVASDAQIWFMDGNADNAASPDEVNAPQLLEGVIGSTE
ncbi:MAG: BMP family ABC transporter substrate-binding protein [Anaerolineae bacterium]|nr:BMP family ABC transporter substrate-binding protein [Anaerolineae bacterium]